MDALGIEAASFFANKSKKDIAESPTLRYSYRDDSYNEGECP